MSKWTTPLIPDCVYTDCSPLTEEDDRVQICVCENCPNIIWGHSMWLMFILMTYLCLNTFAVFIALFLSPDDLICLASFLSF